MNQPPAPEAVEGVKIESAADFFAKAGPLPACWDELRRHPRFYYRACAEALIYPLGAGEDTQPGQCFLVTRDLSRGGLSLLHDKQLFPGQRIDILLNSEPARPTEVVWCRRLAARSYVIGCRFLKGDAPAAS
jgi:PilZ domain-containing protein